MHAKRNFGISKEINTLFLNTKDFRHLELQVSKSFVLSAVQTPGFSPPAPAPAKKTPAPGKKLRLRQKTCEN